MVESGEDWVSSDTGMQERGCFQRVCGSLWGLFSPGRLSPGPPEHQVILAGRQGPWSLQSTDTCSPRPLDASSIKALLG